MQLLRQRHWPGNVRELRNLVHRLVVMEPSQVITAERVRAEFSMRPALDCVDTDSLPVGTSIHDMERGLILKTLEHTAGNKEEAARMLQVSSRTLRNKLARYDEMQLARG